MPPALIGLAGSILPGAISGIGSLLGGNNGEQQSKQAALAAIQGLQTPTFNPYDFQKEQVAGELTPAMESTIAQGPNALSSISTNPQLMSAQMDQLAALQKLGNTGLTASDQEALANINRQTSGNANAAQGAIMANMAARGQLGSGSELAARLSAAQNASNVGNEQGLSLASQAQQKALQAMAQAGGLGNQIQQTQFGQQAQVAAAQNAINQFNAANAQGVAGQNTFAQNQAQAQNLANKQNVMNTNVGLTNAQQQANNMLQQQTYQDAAQKAAMVAGQNNTGFKQSQDQNNQNQTMWGNIGKGVGQATTQIGNYINSQPKTPKESSGADPTDALLTAGAGY